MGVHDLDRYDEVRSALGIPEGEPLFIIRAQDKLAPETIFNYRRSYTQRTLVDGEIPNQEFRDNLDDVCHEFLAWQHDHPDAVKFPD